MGRAVMARPNKYTVDYFTHDAIASQGKTLTIIENYFGHEGYSAWFKLLENISVNKNHVINVQNSVDMEFLCGKMKFRPERLTEILNKLAELDAIDYDLWKHKIIWCDNFVSRLNTVYEKRHQKLPEKPQLDISKVNSTETPISETETPISETETPISETPCSDNSINNSETPQTILYYTKLYNIKGIVKGNNKKIIDNFQEYIEQTLIPKFPNLNITEQFDKFITYWEEGDKKLTRPKTALLNWLERAEQYRKEHNNGHKPEQTPVRKYKELSELPD